MPALTSTLVRFSRLAAYSALACFVVITLIPVVLPIVGIRGYVVRGGSMLPTLHPNDALLVRDVSASALQVGDIATFAHRKDDQTVTHRIVAKKRAVDRILFTSRGDANPASEQWSVAAHDRVGRLTLRIPGGGRLVSAFSSPIGKAVFLVLVAAIAWTPHEKRSRARSRFLGDRAPGRRAQAARA